MKTLKLYRNKRVGTEWLTSPKVLWLKISLTASFPYLHNAVIAKLSGPYCADWANILPEVLLSS
jgi:hypothetical protein